MTIETITVDDKTVVFHNATDAKFYDISSEAERTYNFGGKGFVKVRSPLRLSVSDNGHRIFDAAGQSHYIPTGWVQLTWTVRPEEPNFVK